MIRTISRFQMSTTNIKSIVVGEVVGEVGDFQILKQDAGHDKEEDRLTTRLSRTNC